MNAEVNVNLPIPSVSIDHMLTMRAGAMDKVRAAFALLSEAREMMTAGHLGCVPIAVGGSHRGDYSISIWKNEADALHAAQREIDRGAWSYLMSESGLLTFMDAAAKREWWTALHDHKAEFPELTLDNVAATFSTMYQQRGDMFERGVINCFRALSWDYKTNNPCKFGRRIVTRNVCHYGGQFVNGQGCDPIDDLLRVMHILDGKPEPDHRQGIASQISDVIAQGKAERRRIAFLDTPYISLRWFKNNNAHVTLKRADLVERLNQIIAKHYPGALPARVD